MGIARDLPQFVARGWESFFMSGTKNVVDVNHPDHFRHDPDHHRHDDPDVDGVDSETDRQHLRDDDHPGDHQRHDDADVEDVDSVDSGMGQLDGKGEVDLMQMQRKEEEELESEGEEVVMLRRHPRTRSHHDHRDHDPEEAERTKRLLINTVGDLAPKLPPQGDSGSEDSLSDSDSDESDSDSEESEGETTSCSSSDDEDDDSDSSDEDDFSGCEDDVAEVPAVDVEAKVQTSIPIIPEEADTTPSITDGAVLKELPEESGVGEELGEGSDDEGSTEHSPVMSAMVSEQYYYHCRGGFYFARSEYDLAIADFTEAIRLDLHRKDSALFNHRGRSYNKIGDCNLAIADYSEAIRLDPTQPCFFSNRGMSYNRKGDYDLAIADYSEAIRLDPAVASFFTRRGRSYFKTSEYVLAIADFTEAICLRLFFLNGCVAGLFNHRGRSHNRKRDYDLAIADYSEAIRRDPTQPRFFSNRGRSHYRKKNQYDLAIADYTEAIRLDPTQPCFFSDRGMSYNRKGDYDLAIANYTEAIRLDPTQPWFFSNRGMSYNRKGDYDLAIADYSEAIRHDPTQPCFFSNRGRSYYCKKNQYDLAIADYTEAIRLDPTDGGLLRRRGRCYSEKNEHDLAIGDYTAAIRLDPEDSALRQYRVKSRCMLLESERSRGFRRTATLRRKLEEQHRLQNESESRRKEVFEWCLSAVVDAKRHYYCRGAELRKQEKWDDAIGAFTKTINLGCDSAPAWIQRASCYFGKGEFDLAISDSTEAIRLDPTVAAFFNNRGCSYFEKSEADLAIADYTEAIRLDSKKAVFFYNRGAAFNERKEHDLAIADYAEAIWVDPSKAVFFQDRGASYFKKNEHDLAIADYTEAIRLCPTNGCFFRLRGECFDKKRRYDAAIADYIVAIWLCPKDTNALRSCVKSRCMKLELERSVSLDLTCASRIAFEDERRLQNAVESRLKGRAELAERFHDLIIAKRHHRRGLELQKLEKWDDAIQEFTNTIKLRGDFVKGWSHRALCYFRKGEFGLAIVDYTQAIRLDLRNAVSFNNRGRCYSRKGRHRVAILDYSEAIRLKPKKAVFFYNRGASYFERSDLARAIVDYTEAIRLAPKKAVFFNNRGEAYTARGAKGDCDLAIADYAEAIRLDPTVPVFFYNRGDCHQNKGEYDDAIVDNSAAIYLDPTDGDFFKSRGKCFDKKREYSTAIADYTTAIRLCPEDSEALRYRVQSRCMKLKARRILCLRLARASRRRFEEERRLQIDTESRRNDMAEFCLAKHLARLLLAQEKRRRVRAEAAVTDLEKQGVRLEDLLKLSRARERQIKEDLVVQDRALRDIGFTMREDARGSSLPRFALPAASAVWHRLAANVRVDLGQQLGRGAYGSVFKGELGELSVAVKRVALRDNVQKEVSLMKELNHPFVLKMHGCWFDQEYAWIVTDFCEKGDLSAYLKAEKPPVEDRIRLLGNVVSGMAYLHSNGVVHRDLKPLNVLVTNDVSAKVRRVLMSTTNAVQICDFGISKHDRSLKSLTGTLRGTPRFIAPPSPPRTLKQCDVYAFGILCYEVCSGKTAFAKLVEKYEGEQLVQAIRDQGTYPNVRQDCIGVSAVVQRAIESCWSSDQKEWRSFAELEMVFKAAVEPQKRAASDAKAVEVDA